MPLAEFLQQRWKDVKADSHAAAQVQGAGELLLLFDDAGCRVAHVGEDPPAQVEEGRAGRRQADFAAETQEEWLTKFFLEKQYLPADRRLRNMQNLRSGGE